MPEKQRKQKTRVLLLIDDAKLLDEFNWMLYGHGIPWARKWVKFAGR